MRASVEDLTTKTDYTTSGSTATFKWSGTETFGKLVRAYSGTTYSTYSAINYTSTSELDSADGEFSGDAVADGFEDSELAFYPVNKGNGANVSFPTSGSDFKITLAEELTYAPANPLKDIVPMVGKLSSDSYSFKPLTGVLAIKATNIPTTTTKITISSTGKGLSGTTGLITGHTSSAYKASLQSQLYDAAAGIPLSWFSSAATKSYTVSGLTPTNTYTFYFPIPTGTLPDLTITFYKNSTVLYTVTTSQSITITRGHITPLPLITMPQYKVTVGGTSTAPTGTLYRQNATVFFTVSNSSETLAKESYVDGMRYTKDINNPGQTNCDTYSFIQGGVGKAGLDISTTGVKYLHYLVAPITYGGGNCSAVKDEDIIDRGYVSFYYLNSTDATTYLGTYSTPIANVTKPTGTGDQKIVISASNAPNKALIMASSLFDRGYNGAPIYGTISAGTLTLNQSASYFYTGNNTTYFFLGQSTQKPGQDTAITGIEDAQFTIDATGAKTTLTVGAGKYLHFYYHQGLNGTDNKQWTVAEPGTVFTQQ